MKHDFEYCAKVHPTQWDQEVLEEKSDWMWKVGAALCALIPVGITIANIVRQAFGV
jgi:hypothetical protein